MLSLKQTTYAKYSVGIGEVANAELTYLAMSKKVLNIDADIWFRINLLFSADKLSSYHKIKFSLLKKELTRLDNTSNKAAY